MYMYKYIYKKIYKYIYIYIMYTIYNGIKECTCTAFICTSYVDTFN